MRQSGTTRFYLLDGLRGLAAIAVALFHYHVVNEGAGLFARSYLAVDFFFLLSGFVLAPAIEQRPAGGGKFIKARVLRLWPTMAIGVLIGGVIHQIIGSFPPEADLLLISMSLVGVPLLTAGMAIFPLNVPQWSLLFELIANACHVLLLRWVRTPVLIGLSAASWLILLRISADEGSLDVGANFSTWRYAVFRIGFAYTLGVVMARERHRLVTPFDAAWWHAPSLLLLVLITPSVMLAPASLIDPLALLAFPMVLILALNVQETADLTRWCQWAGRISYPLYAVHFPILQWGHALAEHAPPNARFAVDMASLCLAFVVAWIVAQSRLVNGLGAPARGAAAVVAQRSSS